MRRMAKRIAYDPVAIVLVGIILALALLLRLWGLDFGLPHAYHVDEPTYVSAALNLGAGRIGRQPNLTGFSNTLFVEYAAYFVLGRIVGLFRSLADFEQAYRTDPSMFLLFGRATSATFGSLSVIVIYCIAKEASPAPTKVLAALFLAVAFLHARDSHYAVPDITATLFVILSVLFCLLATQRGKRRFLYLAGITCGLAVATKWSTWPIIIPLVVTALGTQSGFEPIPALLLSTGFFVAGFILGGFQLLIKPAVYWNYALQEWRAGEAGGFGIWQIDTVPGWLFYLKTLAWGIGIPMLALGVAGILQRVTLAIWKKDKASILLLSFPGLYYLLMGATRHYFARYALPLVPFLALCSAEMVGTLLHWVARKPTWHRWTLTALLTLGATIQPLASTIRHDVLLTRQDTRTLAKNWVEANIPAGAKIAIDWPVYGPPLSTLEKPLSSSGNVYTVTLVGGTGLSDHPIEWYQKQGVEYLIASSFIYNIPLVYPQQDAQRKAFYASLDRELMMIQEFRPHTDETPLPFIFDEIYGPAISLWQRDRPGPILKIYKVQ